jgi:hypothetical protein
MQSRALVLVFVAAAGACAAMKQQQAAGGPRPDQGGGRNLKVLPQNITHEELLLTMRGFARGLGQRCSFCHVENPPGSAEQYDFPDDSKRTKNVARTMFLMVRDINTRTLPKVSKHPETVVCWTCHRGQKEPEKMPAPPPDEAGPPRG